jgi:hypothetical protein
VLSAKLKDHLESLAAMKAPRTSTWSFSKASILGDIASVQGNSHYKAAKEGDLLAAATLVDSFITNELINSLLEKNKGLSPLLASVQAVEGTNVNQIPIALSVGIAKQTGWPIDDNLVQINKVGHTKSSGWHRLANQALFSGIVESGKSYILVDDFIGQGGTLANLKGYIESNGGKVVDALILAGKDYSATLKLSEETLIALRGKHGQLEQWWRDRFGFGFDSLTESEARYLIRAENADIIRNKLASTK